LEFGAPLPQWGPRNPTAILPVRGSIKAGAEFLNVAHNPFANTVSISAPFICEGNILLSIFNVNGKKISTLSSGKTENDRTTFYWDGKDAGGALLSKGIYIAQLKAGNKNLSQKIMYLK